MFATDVKRKQVVIIVQSLPWTVCTGILWATLSSYLFKPVKFNLFLVSKCIHTLICLQ